MLGIIVQMHTGQHTIAFLQAACLQAKAPMSDGMMAQRVGAAMVWCAGWLADLLAGCRLAGLLAGWLAGIGIEQLARSLA